MGIDVLKEYVENTKKILELSSLQIGDINNAEEYRQDLLSSFKQIGELSKENNEILDGNFYPVVKKQNDLNDDEIKLLQDFSSLLIDATSMESVDLPLIQIQAERVLKEALKHDNTKLKILALDSVVISCYMMFNLTTRLYPDYDICFKYRDIGMEAGYKILEYLDKDKFIALPDDECKDLVVINSRYIRSLFEWGDKEDKESYNKHDIILMKRALEIAHDDFYLKQLPNHPWIAHKFRAYQYLADFTEYHNRHQFNDEQLKEILHYTQEMIKIVDENPELLPGCPKIEQNFFLLRNTYFAKEMDLETYRNELLNLMKEINHDDFSPRMVFVNLLLPIEYLMCLDKNNLSKKEKRLVTNIYSTIINYVYHTPKTGALSFVLTFLSEILRDFIEVEGGIEFEEMCMKLMAAIHPPTYVHSISVARITRFLLQQVLNKKPEYLVGCLNTNNVEEVKKQQYELLDYTYNAAMLHDIGKIFVTETIITYGRKLIDEEFELLKVHPIISETLLSKYKDTKDYTLFAIGHHKWFNNQGGYPSSFNMDKCKNKPLLSLMIIADCLDAATDTVGRSYKAGKTLDDYIEEIKSFSGTRYDPFAVELFNDKEIYDGVSFLLSEGRNENYREAYRVLKNL